MLAPKSCGRSLSTSVGVTALLSVFALAGGGLGCQTDVPAASGSIGVDADPGADLPGEGDGGGEGPGPIEVVYPDEDSAPVVTITEPAGADAVSVEGASLVIRGTAVDDTGIAALVVEVPPNVALPAPLPDAKGHFEIEVALGYGAQTVSVLAYDISGNVGEDSVVVERPAPAGDDAPPTLILQTPEDAFEIATPTVAVQGSASDDTGVVSVTVKVGDGPELMAETGDHFASFYRETPLIPGVTNVITVTATDASGKTTTVVRSGSTTSLGDLEPPMITITKPADGASTAEDSVTVEGTASDASGILNVQLRVGDGPYQAVSSDDGFATWSATAFLSPGTNVIKARATDNAGLITVTEIEVANTSGEDWSDPVTLTLNWSPADYPVSTLILDKSGLSELIPEGIAGQLVMLELDVRPLMVDALDIIRNACGTGWWADGFSPNCPPGWAAPEVNLWRLVTMTPANANVEGTSIQGMKELADVLATFGLIDDFDVILAAALGIDIHDTFVSSEGVVDALVEGVVGTHPNALEGGFIPVTMLDAMKDMATLAPRFDAVAFHPGFLDSVTGSTYSEVLTDAFEMKMVATSNLHWHDGVALSKSDKAYLALLADDTGPTYEDVVEFDFLSPDTFEVSGVAEDPVVDMVFKIIEYDEWVPVGTSRWPLPRGNGLAWDLDPWLLEPVFADAAFRDYEDHRAGCDYCSGASEGALLYEAFLGIDETEIVIGRQGYGDPEHFEVLDPNPPGWMRIWTLFGLGSPPADQYVWDMILEVAERRLLDGGVVQGEGDVRFELTGIDVGLTGDQIKEAVRPILEEQKSKLSDLLLGDYKESASALDFYLVRGVDGALYLFFVDPDDPVPAGTAGHPFKGFYEDADLKKKVSTTESMGSGDTEHEKIKLGDVGQTVYCKDAQEQLHRIQIAPVGATSVDVTVRRWIGGPQ